MFSRTLIARRAITAIIVAAHSTVGEAAGAAEVLDGEEEDHHRGEEAGDNEPAPAVDSVSARIRRAGACQATAPMQTAPSR